MCVCVCCHGLSLLMDRMYFFSCFFLLSFADSSCAGWSMILKGLHACISVHSRRRCPDTKGVKLVVEQKCSVASCKPLNSRITLQLYESNSAL